MSRLARLRALVALMAGAWALPASAQPSPLVGTWELELMVGVRQPDGSMAPGIGKAKLSIAEKGDSLIATLEREQMPGDEARKPARMAARRSSGNDAKFVHEGVANLSGLDERQATAITTWTFKADGNQLSGTMAIRIEGLGLPDMAPRAFKGVRIG